METRVTHRVLQRARGQVVVVDGPARIEVRDWGHARATLDIWAPETTRVIREEILGERADGTAAITATVDVAPEKA